MVVYDNLKAAVLQILEGHRRLEQDAFRHFASVYCFEALIALVHAGWEKGSVENLVLCRHLNQRRELGILGRNQRPFSKEQVIYARPAFANQCPGHHV